MPRRARLPQPPQSGGNRLRVRVTGRDFAQRSAGFALNDPAGNRRPLPFGSGDTVLLGNGTLGALLPLAALPPHATTHQQGGTDAIKLDDLATPDDNTDLNASITRHGLLKKLSNLATEFLNGQGNFAVPGVGVYQPLDADLTALAALAATGIPARTAADTWALRTLQAGANIALTNPGGVAGDPSIAFSRSVVPDTQTGSVNNWQPNSLDISQDCVVAWAGTAAGAMTGLAGGVAGRIVWIRNEHATSLLTLAHNSSSSSAANRFQCLATGGPTPLAPRGVVCLFHNGTDWRVLAHDQGTWITPAFVAGDFTGSGSMTWTVDSGDVSFDRYFLSGKVAVYLIDYLTTTIGGTVSNTLRRALPAVLLPPTGAGLATMHARIQRNGGATEHGAIYVADIFNPGTLNFIAFDSSNWILGTNNNRVQGTVIWEVA